MSLTLWRSFQQCQWHRWNCFSNVNDTAEIVSAVSMTSRKFCTHKFCSWCPYEICHFVITMISPVSMTPLKSFQQCHWHRLNCFSGVNDTVEIISAVSMTPLKSLQQCHWHRLNWFSSVNDTAEIISAVSMTPLKLEYNQFSWQIRSHMRNCFRAVNQGPRGIVWWKTWGLKILCYCPFKCIVENKFLFLSL
jgi:hypothetical protein